MKIYVPKRVCSVLSWRGVAISESDHGYYTPGFFRKKDCKAWCDAINKEVDMKLFEVVTFKGEPR